MISIMFKTYFFSSKLIRTERREVASKVSFTEMQLCLCATQFL